MAQNVAQLQVSVGADIRGALSGLNTLNRAIGSSAGFFGRAASTAAGFIGGALGLQALQGVAGGASDAIFGFNASLEQSRTSFGVMLGSGQAASDFLQRLQTFAISTPFEFPQLVSAAQRMLAFGFAAGDVIPLLTDIGNVASASPSGFAEGLDRISLALGQMQAKGRVQGDELLQLQEAGVNTGQVFAIMAQQTGKTVPALQKMQQAGKLLPATFITAFQTFSKQRFGGLMEQQSRTFTGAVSNIKDALHIGLAGALAPLFELVKAGAIVLANFLMTPQFQQWVATVQGAVGKVTTVIGAFASEWAALMQAHGVGFFQAGLIALELLIGRTFGPQAAGMFHTFVAFLQQIPAFVTGTLLPVLGQIGAFFQANILPILAFVGAFQGVLQIAGLIAGIATALTFLLSPIGLIAIAAGLLAAAWVTDFGGIQEIVAGFWAVAQPILTDLWTWLSTNLPAALTTLAGFWTGTLLPAITTVWGFLSQQVIPLLLALGGLFASPFLALLRILGVVGQALSTALLPPLQALFGWLSRTLLPVFQAIGTGLAAIGQQAPGWLQNLTTALNTTGATIANVPVPTLPGPAVNAGGPQTVDNSVEVHIHGDVNASDPADRDSLLSQIAAAAQQGQASAANSVPNVLVGAE